MVLPIIVYGDPLLRKKCVDVDKNDPTLPKLIADMFDTMYHAKGVGLAAPQIGKAVRIFIVDASPFAESDDDDDDDEIPKEERKLLEGFKKVFINPRMIEESGEEWKFNEGCLSIPKIREDVSRKPEITLEFYDENFKKHVETYSGVIARVIQHEYDHIEGVLFTDRLSPFKRKMLAGKLRDISTGKIGADYKTRIYRPKK